MDMPSASRFHYRVDERDALIYVSPEWLQFARDNEAARLTKKEVLGKPIWVYIAGLETQYLYRELFVKVREGKASVRVPFRCDSPTARRKMALEVSQSSGNQLDLTGILISEERRPYAALLDRRIERSEERLTICSFCKRARVSESNWLEIEDVIQRLQLFESDRIPGLTHGVCPECLPSL
jgi:hypothetical protein